MVILKDGNTIIDDNTAVKIYVSVFGNDDNDGLTENFPIKTLTKLKSIVYKLAFKSIHILFKQNEVWNESFGDWQFNGINENCPLLISSYPADVINGVNPKFITNINIGITLTGLQNIVIKNIDFTTGFPIPLNNAEYGIQIIDCKNILIDNCNITGYKINVYAKFSENIFIRKNTSSFSHNTSTKASHGLFFDGVNKCNIEGNIFNNNGWDETLQIAKSSLSNGIFINENCQEVVITENKISKSSACGIVLKSGGICSRNIFDENPTALIYGMSSTPALSGRIVDNIVMNSNDINSNLIKGNGFIIGNVNGDLLVDQNLIANTISSKDWGSGIEFNYSIGNGITNLIVKNNKIVKNSTPILITVSDINKIQDIQFENNNFQAVNTVSQPIIIKHLVESYLNDFKELIISKFKSKFIANNLYSDKTLNVIKLMNQINKSYLFATFNEYVLTFLDNFATNAAMNPVITISELGESILELLNINKRNALMEEISSEYLSINLFTGEPYIEPPSVIIGTIPEDMILRFNYEIEMIKKYCDSFNNSNVLDENIKSSALTYFNTCINQLENMKAQMMAMLELVTNKNTVTMTPFKDSIESIDKTQGI